MSQETDSYTIMCPVQVDGLCKEYRSGGDRVQALSNVSLDVKEGEFVTVMGASGSGKSTLLHLMAGLMNPSAGACKVNGVDLTSLADGARTRFRRKNIGVVFQAYNLIPTLSAEENILLPSLIEADRNVSPAELDELLDTLEIKERRRHRPDALSGGEQQRVAIGRALVMQPALILADEPTGNLDSVNSERICKLLRNLCDVKKRTLVVVTHEKNVADWGDRCITLKDGRLAAETTGGAQ